MSYNQSAFANVTISVMTLDMPYGDIKCHSKSIYSTSRKQETAYYFCQISNKFDKSQTLVTCHHASDGTTFQKKVIRNQQLQQLKAAPTVSVFPKEEKV
jgi:hypothetical protein